MSVMEFRDLSGMAEFRAAQAFRSRSGERRLARSGRTDDGHPSRRRTRCRRLSRRSTHRLRLRFSQLNAGRTTFAPAGGAFRSARARHRIGHSSATSDVGAFARHTTSALDLRPNASGECCAQYRAPRSQILELSHQLFRGDGRYQRRIAFRSAAGRLVSRHPRVVARSEGRFAAEEPEGCFRIQLPHEMETLLLQR